MPTVCRCKSPTCACARSLTQDGIVSWRRCPATISPERVQAERDLRLRSNEHVIEKLQAELASPTSEEPTENLSKLLLEYQSLVQTIHSAASPSITVLTSTANKAVDIQRQGLRLELEAIQARYEEGALPRFSYKRLRENVMLMQIDLEDNV